ncbi:hypothetical protein [Mesorhizobium sp. M0500]|uniref:hypothetical protein n=1 Tax=Mesorhizobium sp. M0500 TaxID=2956953 RepID=UPI0033397356
MTTLIIGPRFIDPRQWIPLFAGEKTLMALEGTTEALVVQTLAANYNRISSGLAERPETWRPRFARRNDGSSTPSTGRLPSCSLPTTPQGSGAPVLRGHAATGDIIAPIRDTTGVNSVSTTRASPPLQRRSSPSARTSCPSEPKRPASDPCLCQAKTAVRCS